jgi:hypothetical protein
MPLLLPTTRTHCQYALSGEAREARSLYVDHERFGLLKKERFDA